MRDPTRTAQPDRPVEDPKGDLADPRQLARAARQDQSGTQLNGSARRLEAIAQEFHGFLDPGGDDALEQGPGGDHRTGSRVVAPGRSLDHFLVLIG